MGEDKMLQESQIKDLVIKLKGMAGKVMLPWEGEEELEQLAEVEIEQYPKLWQWYVF